MGDAVRASGLDAIQRRSLLRTRATWRLGWTILTTLVVQGFVCAVAVFPVVLTSCRTYSMTTAGQPSYRSSQARALRQPVQDIGRLSSETSHLTCTMSRGSSRTDTGRLESTEQRLFEATAPSDSHRGGERRERG
jgi:hypothetical protein